MPGLVSRACQTEIFVTTESNEKCFFRIVFEGRTLQFKLPKASALSVMFSKIPVVGDFIWHGIVLDGALSPMHYNMLPGEENCATLHVVLNSHRVSTFGDDIVVNDAIRAAGFRLRLQEEENDSLKIECDELRAQIFALHRELSSVVENNAQRLEEERRKREEVLEKNLQLQAAFRRLESDHELLKRRSSVRNAMQGIHSKSQTGIPTIRVHCVVIEHDQSEGNELPFIEIPEPATVAAALERLMSTHSSRLPPPDQSMICVRSAQTGEFRAVDDLTSHLSSGDSLYIAKMEK
jgi:hypothetical protein